MRERIQKSIYKTLSLNTNLILRSCIRYRLQKTHYAVDNNLMTNFTMYI